MLDRDEQNKLIAAALDAEEPAAFGIIFDLFTGIRLGELCELRWENSQWNRRPHPRPPDLRKVSAERIFHRAEVVAHRAEVRHDVVAVALTFGESSGYLKCK